MADKRKDTKGRNLKDNEDQMPDGRYRFRYTDKDGERKAIYSWKLTATDKPPQGKRDGLSLRQKEKEIEKDLQDGIDPSLASKITLNDMFDRYIKLKTKLKEGTRVNYIYMYNHFVRDSIGNRKVNSFKYSDIKEFYNDLLKNGMKISTLDNVHSVVHPTFTLAVRDGIIRINPSDGLMKELKQENEKSNQRHALTIQEQELLIDFLKQSPQYNHWLPVFTFLLGTGCRIGEALGLRWSDVDFKSKTISINHNVTYKPDETGHSVFHVNTPKTDAGIRTIPMFDAVRQALLQIKEHQMELGIHCSTVVEGYSDFIFINRYGTLQTAHNINRAIERIIPQCNEFEMNQAKEENRTPVQIRPFSVHNLRHTFCTRLCEVENNIKLIMAIMGHADVQTTMNIYNEIQETKKKESFEALEGKIKIS